VPNPQSPIPNPQFLSKVFNLKYFIISELINLLNKN